METDHVVKEQRYEQEGDVVQRADSGWKLVNTNQDHQLTKKAPLF